MGFRFFRRMRIAPGVSINLGKRGASVSVGPRGAKMTFGSKGVKSSVGIPGTGIRYETPYSGGSRTRSSSGGGGGGFLLSLFLLLVSLAFAIVSICLSICTGVNGMPDLRWFVGFLVSGCLAIYFIYDMVNTAISEQGSGSVQINRPVNRVSGRWTIYTKEMICASNALFAFLSELNRSTRCRNLLKQLKGMDEIPSCSNTFSINDRLALIAYCDARDSFKRLGHSIARLHNLEGVGYCAYISQLLKKGFDTSLLLDSGKAREVAGIVEKNLANDSLDMTICGHENESRFELIFGRKYNEHEWVQRYATLMYRWASLIAKADGTVTEEESRTLDSIMQMTKDKPPEGNVRVSGSADSHGSADTWKSDQYHEAYEPSPKEGLDTVIKQLDELIGLDRVKKEVRQLINFIKIQMKRKENGLKVAPITYHCVFTGNPGTGKTTVARILAEIYREMGIVKKGHLVETDRSGLIAEYVGQTAIKTNKIIDSALDGVLFIDEAYSLVQGGEKDYGRESISTLLKRMEDDRGRLVVILAGYTNEMKEFIDSNPGLQSRFNRYIEFPDYGAAELAKIFLMKAEKSQYMCDDDVRASIVDIMDTAVRDKDKNFGNARFVRNLFEKAIQRQATRLSTVAPLTAEMLSELTLHDLGFEYED